MYDIAITLLKELDKLGYTAYIIGGFPRDLLLNIENNDIDIATNAHPDTLKQYFDVIKDNSKFGSLTIKYNDYLFEITSFRKELKYNNRYPEIEYVDTLKEDLIRRDFTINTICIDKDKNYIDLLNGIDDLNKKQIKTINNPYDKIKEDPLRILRAIRLQGKLNFKLDKSLESCIIEYGHLIESLSKNTIKKELSKMNDKSIELLKQYKLDKYIKEII